MTVASNKLSSKTRGLFGELLRLAITSLCARSCRELFRLMQRPPNNSNTQQVHCGSGLARESAVSVSAGVADPPHSRASPLPHFFTAFKPLPWQVSGTR
ncbi:hypothetical protein FFI16_009190 [Pseudomonas sp. KBS0710]|nr:hypothetical protein FFI16_009190 [Pseudomonas sp. KBS0710]